MRLAHFLTQTGFLFEQSHLAFGIRIRYCFSFIPLWFAYSSTVKWRAKPHFWSIEGIDTKGIMRGFISKYWWVSKKSRFLTNIVHSIYLSNFSSFSQLHGLTLFDYAVWKKRSNHDHQYNSSHPPPFTICELDVWFVFPLKNLRQHFCVHLKCQWERIPSR